MVGGIRNCKHVKGFSVLGDQLPVLPKRVRKQEIEQMTFFEHFLLFVKNYGTLREFENPDALLYVMAVGILTLFDLAPGLCLLKDRILAS